jgi:hypothetical protein
VQQVAALSRLHDTPAEANFLNRKHKTTTVYLGGLTG